jgi:hypothetical protein
MTEAMEGAPIHKVFWVASNATDSDMMRDEDDVDLPDSA